MDLDLPQKHATKYYILLMRLVILIGIILIMMGILFNQYFVMLVFSEDGVLSYSIKKAIWLLEFAAIILGIALLCFSKRNIMY